MLLEDKTLDTWFYHSVETAESQSRAESMSIANRLGQLGEVVPVIAFLCAPEARRITAQTIRVNGGMY